MNNKHDRRLYFELFYLSVLSLYLELFAIRWLSVDVRAFTIFRTFPLVACFVGLGLGYARGNAKSVRLAAPALFLFAMVITITDKLQMTSLPFLSDSVFQWTNIMVNRPGGLLAHLAYLASFTAILLILLAGPFFYSMFIGSRLGALFNQLSPLPAYALNLLGASIGSIVFTIICFYLGASPLALICFPIAILLCCMISEKRYSEVVILLAIPIVISLCGTSGDIESDQKLEANFKVTGKTFWSPYQRLQLNTFQLKNASAADNSIVGLNLVSNRLFYQAFFDEDLDRSKLPPAVTNILDQRHRHYNMPYKIKQNAKDILIVGAGIGQNVQAAVKNQATDIDAVEIDPLILRLGAKFNPYYARHEVHPICDDARHFFNTCKKKYDLIIFALIDSHTVTGMGSSVRLDAYVFTKESFCRALSLLKPNGVLFLSFAGSQPWIATRLYQTLQSAYQGNILALSYDSPYFLGGHCFICGVPQDLIQHLGNMLPGEWKILSSLQDNTLARPVLTDDWPYLYVKPDVIDYPYLIVVASILLLSVFLSRKTIFDRSVSSIYWQSFFLGAGFLLLELQAIARLSLVFGSTWLTSAIVINAVLLLILAANMLVIKIQKMIAKLLVAIYFLLFLALCLSFCLPMNELFPITSRLGIYGYLLIITATILPVFFAGLIFPSIFAKVNSPSRALTFNVLGAVAGGLLEYASYYIGNNGLIMISAFLYLCSFICYLRYTKTKAA